MDYLLMKGEVVTFRTGKMEAVTVLRGRIWLTKYADQTDYCLEAGDRLPIGQAGNFVVEALQDAALCILLRDPSTGQSITLSWARQPLAGRH